MHSGAPDLYAQATATWLAVHLLTSPSSSEPIEYGRKPGLLQDQRLARVIDYMLGSIDSEINLAQLAVEAGVSKYHFSGLFRQKTGLSPMKYLYARRLSMAERMLIETDSPIKVIASQCGFPNISHFTTSFRRRYGLPPKAYRARRD